VKPLTKKQKPIAAAVERHQREKIGGEFVSIPMSLLNSSGCQALSHTALKLFVIMCAEHQNQWNGYRRGFEISYDKIQARGISRDWIGPALRELEAFGVIRLIRLGHGGCNAKARADSHYELAFLGPGKKPYEKNLSVGEWKTVFDAARSRKSIRHVRNGKKSNPPLKSIFSVPLEPTSSVPFEPTRYPRTGEKGPVCSVPLEPTIPSYVPHDIGVAGLTRVSAAHGRDDLLVDNLPPMLAMLPWSPPRRRELIPRGRHLPDCEQVERHDSNLLGVNLGAGLAPVRDGQTLQASVHFRRSDRGLSFGSWPTATATGPL
jgi:hypothetical protein